MPSLMNVSRCNSRSGVIRSADSPSSPPYPLMPLASLAAATAILVSCARVVMVGPLLVVSLKNERNIGAFSRDVVPHNSVDMLVWMSAAIEPSIAAHDADIAADDRAQRVVAFVKPLQVAEGFAVVAPFGRGVAVLFVEPHFAFGKAAREQFGKWFERDVDGHGDLYVFRFDRDLRVLRLAICGKHLCWQ